MKTFLIVIVSSIFLISYLEPFKCPKFACGQNMGSKWY